MEYQFESIGPTLRIVVLVVLIVFALLLLGLVVMLAALPGKIAKSRQHPQAEAVNVCGWVGLATGFLWAIALVWAFWRYEGTANSEPSTTLIGKLSRQIDGLEKSIARLESNRKDDTV